MALLQLNVIGGRGGAETGTGGDSQASERTLAGSHPRSRTAQLSTLGTFRTRREADEALSLAVVGQSRGEWVRPERGRVTVEEWVGDWWPTKQHLRPTTLAQYRYLLDKLTLPQLGSTRLDRLDPQLIARWRSELLARPGLSPMTVTHAYRLLRQMLGAAVDARYLATNPCSIRGAATERAAERRIPTVEEALALVAEMPADLRAFILLASFSGLRLGECQALRRRHVDVLHRTVRVEEQVTEPGGRLVVGPPKSDAGVRTVDVPRLVAEALDQHLATVAAPGADGLVFRNGQGGYVRRRQIYRSWQSARTAVGRPELRIHDLRHLAGTLGTLSGATIREQMARLGHASPAPLCATSTSWRVAARSSPKASTGSSERSSRAPGRTCTTSEPNISGTPVARGPVSNRCRSA